jgi:hypothetical protein
MTGRLIEVAQNTVPVVAVTEFFYWLFVPRVAKWSGRITKWYGNSEWVWHSYLLIWLPWTLVGLSFWLTGQDRIEDAMYKIGLFIYWIPLTIALAFDLLTENDRWKRFKKWLKNKKPKLVTVRQPVPTS